MTTVVASTPRQSPAKTAPTSRTEVISTTTTPASTTSSSIAARPDGLEDLIWFVREVVTADGSVVIEGAGPWMAFEDGVLAVAADCSNAWSAYDLADGTVTFGPTARVPITCDLSQNRAVDDDLLTTLSGSATVEIGDESLTVTNGSRTVVAEPTPVSPDDVPDLLLTNAAWNIQLLFVDGAPSPLPPTGYEGRLQFDGANVWFFVGCAAGRAEYRYSPDGLTLGPLQLNADSCDVDSAGPAEHVVLTLLTGTLHRAIHGRSLAIVNGSTILSPPPERRGVVGITTHAGGSGRAWRRSEAVSSGGLCPTAVLP